MDHTGAIAQYLIPLLLALLCGLASYGCYMHKQFMSRNEREHDRLFKKEEAHESRLTRCETKIEFVEQQIKSAKG